MKITPKITLSCLLILAAGCASDERHSTYSSSSYSTEPPFASDVISSATDQSDADRALAGVVRAQFDRYGALATLSQNIQIKAKNGTVTLTGNVPGDQEKRMVDAMVENTPGVLAVHDEMRVSTVATVPFNQSDRALCTRVRQALVDRPTVAAYVPNIGVSADKGVVTLSGNVPSEADRQTIEDIARNTPGVAGLIDRMQAPLQPTGRIEPAPRAYSADAGEMFSLHVQGLNETDRTVSERILQGLRTDVALTALLPIVNISVADGKVTLRGTVQTDEQRRTIVSSVQRAAGVNNVIDELQVQPAR
jgi:osmotically-inducible protein OsmY